MGWSPLSTEVHNTSQYSARTRAAAGVVLHHGATTSADAIINMMVSGSRQVSSHQVVKDTRNAGVVQEQFRAWSLGDAYWDSWAFTVECANESTDGWTISASSQETLAQLVADWAKRYGFWPHRTGDPKLWTVYGHREIYSIHGGSYATACPGAMDLNWITARAQQLLSNTKGKQNMTINFVDTSTYSGGFAVVGTVCATAGESAGTPANWVEYKRTKLAGEYASQMADRFGPHVPLDKAAFAAMKAAYLAPLNVAGGGSGGVAAPTAAQNAAAVQAILADDFAGVNANIDDQPTQFTVAPK